MRTVVISNSTAHDINIQVIGLNKRGEDKAVTSDICIPPGEKAWLDLGGEWGLMNIKELTISPSIAK